MTPHINFDGLPHQIHHRSTSRNTPVSRANEPPAQMPQLKKSDALKLGLSVGATCLGEYSLLQTNISSSRETATVGSKKRKLFPTKILMELDLEDIGETLTAPPRSNVNPSTAPPRSNVNPTSGATQSSCTQLHESSQHHEIVLPQGQNHQHENTSVATPSSIWPSNLITILQRIAALPCRQPLKPLFAFKFKQELHPPNAQVWWRPIISPASPKQLASRIWIRIQAYQDAQFDLQKPSKLELNEASSHTWIKVAPSAP